MHNTYFMLTLYAQAYTCLLHVLNFCGRHIARKFHSLKFFHANFLGVNCIKFNVHNISKMSIAFFGSNMLSCMHNLPSCMHNLPLYIHNMSYSNMHSKHVVMYAHITIMCIQYGSTCTAISGHLFS